MKTTEEIIKEWLKSQEYTGVYIGYEEGDDLDSVSIDGYVDLESLSELLWNQKWLNSPVYQNRKQPDVRVQCPA